ncbi:MAG: SDR family NAD(P)-dependent oxidoreductase [Anaerolineales bacterium]
MNTVITGASSGIGRAMAKTFAREGHAVLAVARRGDRLAELAREVPHVHPLPLDITAPGAPQAVLMEAVERYGKVHILVNNAGMSPYQEFRELRIEHLRRILAVNAAALAELCHFFLPHMLAHGEPARIANVGSVGGYAPLPKFAMYSGSKHFVRVFTDILARECRKTNVRVCGVYPGGTLTEFPPLAGQRPRPISRAAMVTAEQFAEKVYPGILRGRRVIMPGFSNRLVALAGKVLPFPLAMRLTEFIYGIGVEQIPTAYPLNPNPSPGARTGSREGMRE